MAQAGFAEGFSVTLDYYAAEPFRRVAQAIQADLGAIGIKAQPLGGSTQQVTTKTRTCHHEMAMASRISDYIDPHSNAQAFYRGVAVRNKTEAKVHSALKPDYYRIYRIESAADVVKSAATGVDHTQSFAFKASGGLFSQLFDGSEKLISVTSLPWYSRQVTLPDRGHAIAVRRFDGVVATGGPLARAAGPSATVARFVAVIPQRNPNIVSSTRSSSRPKSPTRISSRTSESSSEQQDGSGIEEGCCRLESSFEILGETTVAPKRGKETLDRPAPGMHGKADMAGLLAYDLDDDPGRGRHSVGGIGAIGEDTLDEGIQRT